MADQRNRLLKKLIELIGKPEADRPEEEIQALAPWLAKVAGLFHFLSKEQLILLLQLCSYENVSRDQLIIRQGDVGDCFYVMLSGKSSLYVDLDEGPRRVSSAAEEKEEKEGKADGDVWEEVWEKSGTRCLRLDRTKFGTYVCGYEAGKGFGEVALIDPRSLRTGSVIADDDCDLLVIGRRLFDETLRERLVAEWEKRRAFVDSSPLFGSWPAKTKRLLDVSLVQRLFPFDSCVVRQGSPFAGLQFIVRGEAVVSVDVDQHRSQYPKILDRRAKVLAEIGRSTSNRKEEREQGSAEKRKPEAEVKGHRTRKSITICAIDQTEVIGALEFVLGLDTYAQTIVSSTDLEVLTLDVRGIDRLLGRGKQSPTALYLEAKVKDRLSARLKFTSGSKVELYRHLLNNLIERKRIRETQVRNSGSNRTLHFRISSPSDPNPRGSGDDRMTPAAPTRGKTPEDQQRPSSTIALTLDPTANLFHNSSALAAYYLAHIVHRSKKFSRAYLKSREGGYGRQNETVSSGGQRLIVDRATRLLPRSRRELEHVALGGKHPRDPRPTRTQNQAIQRYLSPPPAATADPDRLELARGLVQRSSAHSYRRSRDGFHDDDDDDEADDDDVMLGLEETLSDGRLRDVVMKIGGYHDDVTASRRRSIVQSVIYGGGGGGERRPGAGTGAGAGDRRLVRPKMTPAATAAFDQEASDENLRKLEEKLRKFYSQMVDDKDNDVPIVQKLRRFEITNAEDIPIPAGTVYVCRRFRGNRDSRCIVGSHGNNKSSAVAREEEESSSARSSRQTTRRYMIPKTAYPLLTSVLSNQEMESEKLWRQNANRASYWSMAQSNE